MQSTATTIWNGDLVSGSGTTSLASGLAKDLPVSWKARTEGQAGNSTPEELLAAAHASCFSMAFTHRLAQSGTPATRMEVSSTVTFERTEAGPKILSSALQVTAEVPGIAEAEFQKVADDAKDGCPVSGALKGNVDITLQATLKND